MAWHSSKYLYLQEKKSELHSGENVNRIRHSVSLEELVRKSFVYIQDLKTYAV